MLSIIKKEANTKDRNNPILEVRGLSTDDKPLENITNGSEFIEIDTGDKYFYNAEGSEWIKMSSGGGSAKLQDKEITITENTTTTVNPDAGYDGLRKVDITTNVPSSGGKYTPSFISFFGYTGTDLSDEIENLDTSNITNMRDMFNSCSSITELDLSSFDTTNVTSYMQMFYSCSSLATVDLSSFTTKQGAVANNMFGEGYAFQEIDMSNFDFTKLSSYEDMFYGVSTDCLIYVKDATQQTWLQTNFGMSNVQIKS